MATRNKKFYETAAFRKLQKEWYGKAAATGFEDIETFDYVSNEPTNVLKGMSPGDLRRGLYKPESEEYYRLARGHRWQVANQLDRYIWTCHSEGISMASIKARLKSRSPVGMRKISRTIQRERDLMLKAWYGS